LSSASQARNIWRVDIVVAPLDQTPFASLTLIAAPAVLTNACSILVLSTSNRLARAVDWARSLAQQLEASSLPADAVVALRFRQMTRIEDRSVLLLHALRLFYLALGSFALASFTSLIGAVLAPATQGTVFKIVLAASACVGMTGVGSLVFGCVMLVHETRLAVMNVSEEVKSARDRLRNLVP
jgi:hypothetical protein